MIKDPKQPVSPGSSLMVCPSITVWCIQVQNEVESTRFPCVQLESRYILRFLTHFQQVSLKPNGGEKRSKAPQASEQNSLQKNETELFKGPFSSNTLPDSPFYISTEIKPPHTLNLHLHNAVSGHSRA